MPALPGHGELVPAPDEVRHRVGCDRCREEIRLPRDEHQRLLAAHAVSGRVDAARVVAEIRNAPPEDPRQRRHLGDVRRPGPGAARDDTSMQPRIDDDQPEAVGKVAPTAGLLPGREAARVGRDDERQARIVARPVPGRQPDDSAVPAAPGAREADLEPPCPRSVCRPRQADARSGGDRHPEKNCRDGALRHRDELCVRPIAAAIGRAEDRLAARRHLADRRSQEVSRRGPPRGSLRSGRRAPASARSGR